MRHKWLGYPILKLTLCGKKFSSIRNLTPKMSEVTCDDCKKFWETFQFFRKGKLPMLKREKGGAS